MSEPTIYTRDQVKAHSDRDDLWMVIHGKVYNVTKFVDEHPGGEEVLIDTAGLDGSDAFEDVGHSEEARKILDELKVGELDPSEVTTKSSPSSSTQSSSSQSSAPSPLLLLSVLTVIGGIAFYLYEQSRASS